MAGRDDTNDSTCRALRIQPSTLLVKINLVRLVPLQGVLADIAFQYLLQGSKIQIISKAIAQQRRERLLKPQMLLPVCSKIWTLMALQQRLFTLKMLLEKVRQVVQYLVISPARIL